MKLHERMKKIRREKGVTQEEMAKTCGLSKNYISAIERGVNKCNAETFIAYAQKLGVSLDYLAGLKESDLPDKRRQTYTDDIDYLIF